MAIDLGQWKWAANLALDYGVPALGMAFGIPGPVSSFAVNSLKKALGLPATATAEETQAAAQADPDTARAAFSAAESEVTARYAYLTRLAEVAADVAKTNISEVNATIRSETSAGVSWWHWRHLLGYLVLMYGLEQVAAIGFTMFGRGVPPDQLATMFNSTAVFTVGLFGLLGYVAADTTALKTAVITGQQPEGVVKSVVKAVTGRK